MITCKELIDFLAGYLDGELPATERAAFDQHLAACPSCVAYLQTYQQAVQLGKNSVCCDGPAGPMPESLVKAIIEARTKTG